ncbi:murein hydrolase activator EnvC family protein [Sphingomonas chungangi]|uniref:murein hydrolase activator EnvC family protein n=1 Tax=Sphingomonas chungangi TaxID=2683589 RepID=UPI0031B617D8
MQAAQSDIAAAQARIQLIASLQQIARRKIADRQGPILHLTAALQTMARRPPALAIAQPGSIEDIVHVRLLLADTLPVIQARTAGLRADLDKQTQLRTDAERAIAALGASQKLLAQRQRELASLEQTAIRKSQRLAEQAADEQQRALGLGEEARDAADRMQSAEDAGDIRARLERLAGPDMRPAGAGDAMPASGRASRYRLPTPGRVETGYGEVSPAGVRSRGLTVAPQPGADIVAPAAGTIVYAKPFRSYGQVVIIDHGGGWTTTLTGLASIAVRAGQHVAQGDAIGSGGASRNARVTAELRHGNRPIDIVAMAQAG